MAQRDPGLWRQLMAERGITYLQDSEVTIDGLRIWGSPWQPEFYDWAFNLPRGDALKEKWDLIPAGIDILVTHGPPRGKLDMTYSYAGFPRDEVGCWDLARAVARIKPKVHVFGHIHVGYGVVEENGTTFVNPSSCDDNYDATQDPIVLEINNGKVEVVHVGQRAPIGSSAPKGLWG
jgi:predicted phosphodiesterase